MLFCASATCCASLLDASSSLADDFDVVFDAATLDSSRATVASSSAMRRADCNAFFNVVFCSKTRARKKNQLVLITTQQTRKTQDKQQYLLRRLGHVVIFEHVELFVVLERL